MTLTFQLNDELLNPVLQNLFNSNTAITQTAEIIALKPGLGNPTSLGVYRVSGTALVNNSVEPFSLVVKHLATGMPFMDTTDPKSWNHWLREIKFFESPLVALIPKEIAYPKYLGQSTLQDGTALFWNSDLGDLTKAKWTWEKCLEAAELVAQLNSVSEDIAEPYVWLNRTQLQGWLEFRDEFFVPFEQQIRRAAVENDRSERAYQFWGRFLNQQLELSKIVWDARQTFVHGDFNLNNLMPLDGIGNGLIALDWQLCGVSGIGSELASIFNTAVELGVIQGTLQEFNELAEVYVTRFNKINPSLPTSLNEVRLVAAALGFTIISAVTFFFMRGGETVATEEMFRSVVDKFSSSLMLTYSNVLHELL